MIVITVALILGTAYLSLRTSSIAVYSPLGSDAMLYRDMTMAVTIVAFLWTFFAGCIANKRLFFGAATIFTISMIVALIGESHNWFF